MKEEQARGNTQAAVRKTFQEAWRQVHPVLSLFSNNALPTLLLPAPPPPPPPPPPPLPQMEHQQRVLGVWRKYDCNPAKSLIGMVVQAPLFIGFFSALRGFATHKVRRRPCGCGCVCGRGGAAAAECADGAPHHLTNSPSAADDDDHRPPPPLQLPSLTEGGALWFTDLTVADPTYGLPLLASLTFLATIELGAADGMEGQVGAGPRGRAGQARRCAGLGLGLGWLACGGSPRHPRCMNAPFLHSPPPAPAPCLPPPMLRRAAPHHCQTDAMRTKMKMIMRGVALIILPFSASLPASVFMYWTGVPYVACLFGS